MIDLSIALVPDAAGIELEIDGVTYRTLRRNASDELLVAVSSLPLPSGAATAANQATMITALQLIDDLRAALADVAADELRVNLITPFTPTSLGNGQKTVSSHGTAEQLDSDQACKAVTIAALPSNSGNIYVGDSGVSSSNGRVLDAGDAIDVAIDNLNRIYIDADNDDEGVSFLWVS